MSSISQISESVNPIIRGFSPDPAICRRGDEFFIAVSSFQWWPGVPIYRSLDLRNWELHCYALFDEKMVNLRRIGDSAGIWAPSLTYADGLFWLVFSPASGTRNQGYESPNYLTTASNIEGPWSDPVFLNASGNDASLFHDNNGKKYILNTHQIRSPEGSHLVEGHAGTLLQEYDSKSEKLVGVRENIFPGTDLGIPEGSKMYQRDKWYYLSIAEGGTEYGHCVTLARSRNVMGPYEVHPDNPILTSRDNPDNPIQRAGHADFLTLENGQVAVVYLASRPSNKASLCGRETFMARGRWDDDGWLRLDSRDPQLEIPDFGLPLKTLPAPAECDHFDSPTLGKVWNTLRQPANGRLSLVERSGWLRLQPNHCFLDSIEHPAAVFRRIEHRAFFAETLVSFQPEDSQQWAGLACYYDTRHWYYIYRGWRPGSGSIIGLCGKGIRGSNRIEALGEFAFNSTDDVEFRVSCEQMHLQFSFRPSGTENWRSVGPLQDASVLTDEYVESEDPIPNFGFTGAFVGVAAWDMTGVGPVADFDFFKYKGDRSEWPP